MAGVAIQFASNYNKSLKDSNQKYLQCTFHMTSYPPKEFCYSCVDIWYTIYTSFESSIIQYMHMYAYNTKQNRRIVTGSFTSS